MKGVTGSGVISSKIWPSLPGWSSWLRRN